MGYKYYILFFIPFFLSVYFSGTSIYFLLRNNKAQISPREILKFRFLSKSIGLFLPGQLGELSLVGLLKNKIPMSMTLAVITTDKIISFSIMVFIGITSSLFFFHLPINEVLFSVLASMMILVPLGFQNVREKIIKHLPKFIRKPFFKYSESLGILYKYKKKALFLDIILTLTLLIFASITIKILLSHLNYSIPLAAIISIQSLSTLSSLLPISMGGAGIRESIAVYLLFLLGVPPLISGSMYLTFLFVSYMVAMITLIFSSKYVTKETFK
tara:strand:+ start:1620 stop:2432 length:813 start_codon:yes stop_codon:yes gene_type:complete